MIYNNNLSSGCCYQSSSPNSKIKITLIVCTALTFLGLCMVGTLALISNFTYHPLGFINNISWPLGLSLILLGSIVSSVCFTLLLMKYGFQKCRVEIPLMQHQKNPIKDNPPKVQWVPEHTLWIANSTTTQNLTKSKINKDLQFITQTDSLNLNKEDITKTILFYTPNYIDADFAFLNDNKLAQWGEDFFDVFKKYQAKLGKNFMVIPIVNEEFF